MWLQLSLGWRPVLCICHNNAVGLFYGVDTLPKGGGLVFWGSGPTSRRRESDPLRAKKVPIFSPQIVVSNSLSYHFVRSPAQVTDWFSKKQLNSFFRESKTPPLGLSSKWDITGPKMAPMAATGTLPEALTSLAAQADVQQAYYRPGAFLRSEHHSTVLAMPRGGPTRLAGRGTGERYTGEECRVCLPGDVAIGNAARPIVYFAGLFKRCIFFHWPKFCSPVDLGTVPAPERPDKSASMQPTTNPRRQIWTLVINGRTQNGSIVLRCIYRIFLTGAFLFRSFE